jgi:hypothetical protein
MIYLLNANFYVDILVIFKVLAYFQHDVYIRMVRCTMQKNDSGRWR